MKGKKHKRLRKPTREQTVKAAELFRLAGAVLTGNNVKQMLYRSRYGMRLPYAYVVFRSGKQCRHREPGLMHELGGKRRVVVPRGPLCGDVWELATLRLETGKLISAVCYMHGHKKGKRLNV